MSLNWFMLLPDKYTDQSLPVGQMAMFRASTMAVCLSWQRQAEKPVCFYTGNSGMSLPLPGSPYHATVSQPGDGTALTISWLLSQGFRSCNSQEE